MKDSGNLQICYFSCVVNCFQKLLSSWWRTAKEIVNRLQTQLWIAFKNYYLRDEGQRYRSDLLGPGRCELLSKIIIFVMKDSLGLWYESIGSVVNCFQKLLSSWWRTAMNEQLKNELRLWIAFKNYYLRDEGQPGESTVKAHTRCELLSKIIIFVMKDSQI